MRSTKKEERNGSSSIRLARGGTKKRPHYNIVIADSRSPRDGRFIQKIGFYNPLLPSDHADRLKLDLDAAKAWIAKGAVASDRVHKFLANAGLVKAAHAQQSAEGPAQEEGAGTRCRRGRRQGGRSRPKTPRRRSDGGAGRPSCRRHRRAGPEGRGEGENLHRRARGAARYGALHDKDGRRFRSPPFAPKTGRGGDCRCRASPAAMRRRRCKGTELFVARAALPATGAEEFYHADLIGLEAQDSEGRVLGTVHAIHNYGAGDVIEIARPDGDSVLLAFTRETCRRSTSRPAIVVAVPRRRGQ